MKTTEKYQFNLIDTSDAFGPERLNENTQKVEDKLAALESADNALAVADLALAQADVANKSELQNAINSKAAELQAAIQTAQSAAQTAASSALAAHAADTVQHALVKLGSVEVPADTVTSFAISNPDDYSMFLVLMNLKGYTSATPYIFINNISKGLFGFFSSNSYVYHCTLILEPVGSIVCGRHTMLPNTGASLSDNFSAADVPWSDLRSVGLKCSGTDATLTVYGLKA